jgi:hypothetical protein
LADFVTDEHTKRVLMQMADEAEADIRAFENRETEKITTAAKLELELGVSGLDEERELGRVNGRVSGAQTRRSKTFRRLSGRPLSTRCSH